MAEVKDNGLAQDWEKKAASLMGRGTKKGTKKSIKQHGKDLLNIIDLGWDMATKKERKKMLKAIKMDKKEFKRFLKGKRKHLSFDKLIIVLDMFDIEMNLIDPNTTLEGED